MDKKEFKKFDKGAIIEALLSVLDDESVNKILNHLNKNKDLIYQRKISQLNAAVAATAREIALFKKQIEDLDKKIKDQYQLNDISLKSESVQDSLVMDIFHLQKINKKLEEANERSKSYEKQLKKYIG